MKLCSTITVLIAYLYLAPTAIGQDHFLNSYSQQFQNRNNTYAGLYFSMPLGGKKKKADAYKFGFKMTTGPNFLGNGFAQQSVNFRGRNSFGLKGRQQFTGQMEVMNITFNQNGFKQANVMHLPLVMKASDGRFIYLDDKEDGKKGGITVGKVLLWTGVAVGALIVVGVAASCVEDIKDDDDNENFLDFGDAACPV